MTIEDNNSEPILLKLFLQALAAPELKARASDSATQSGYTNAARHLAICLGQCRLSDINLGDADGALPEDVAAAACASMTNILDDAIDDHDSFLDRWESAQAQMELEELATAPLQTRIDAWAVYVAVDEAVLSAVGWDTSSLEAQLDRLGNKIEDFDIVLQKDTELLSVAAETFYLENCRNLLAGDFQYALPWFLDGRLEIIAFSIDRPDTSVVKFLCNRSETDETEAFPQTAVTPVLAMTNYRRAPREIAAMAAAGQEVFPIGAVATWAANSDGSGHRATMIIPANLQADGTRTRILFDPFQNDDICGLTVAFGPVRGVIERRSSRLEDQFIYRFDFSWEELRLVGNYVKLPELRVDGKGWYFQVEKKG